MENTLDIVAVEEQNQTVSDKQVRLNILDLDIDENKVAIKRAANWFYWIAALTLINSVMGAAGANINFIAGTAITQVVDAFMLALFDGYSFAALLINILIVGFVASLGFAAGKIQKWPFLVGATLYGLDACIFAYVGEWLPVIFHGYVLFVLFKGFSKINTYNELVTEREALI